MTTAEIMALSGRELDEAVAVRVMGWKKTQPNVFWHKVLGNRTPCVTYSKDMNNAWTVFRRVVDCGPRQRRRFNQSIEYQARLVSSKLRDYREGLAGLVCLEALKNIMPTAICRAALIAMEGE